MNFLQKIESRYQVIATDSPKIAAIRKIVTEKSMGTVEGTKVDLYSASAIIQVFDNLNPENQKKYEALPVKKMADVAFKLSKK